MLATIIKPGHLLEGTVVEVVELDVDWVRVQFSKWQKPWTFDIEDVEIEEAA